MPIGGEHIPTRWTLLLTPSIGETANPTSNWTTSRLRYGIIGSLELFSAHLNFSPVSCWHRMLSVNQWVTQSKNELGYFSIYRQDFEEICSRASFWVPNRGILSPSKSAPDWVTYGLKLGCKWPLCGVLQTTGQPANQTQRPRSRPIMPKQQAIYQFSHSISWIHQQDSFIWSQPMIGSSMKEVKRG